MCAPMFSAERPFRMAAALTAFAGSGRTSLEHAGIPIRSNVASAASSLSNGIGAARLITENPDPHRTAAPTFRAGELAGALMRGEGLDAPNYKRWAPKGSHRDLSHLQGSLRSRFGYTVDWHRSLDDLHAYDFEYNRRRADDSSSPRLKDEVGLWRDLLENRSEEHTYELQSLMRISYAVF